MRNTKTFQLRKKLVATVYELTVAQALEIFWLLGDFAYPAEFEAFLLAHHADALAKARELVKLSPDISFKKLSADEIQTVVGHFIAVNKAFFNSDNEQQSTNQYGVEYPDLTGFEHYENLSGLVNSLVRLNHTDVLNYPMSLVNNVAEALKAEAEKNGE